MENSTTVLEAISRIQKSLADNPNAEPIPDPKYLSRRQISTEKCLFETRELKGTLADEKRHLSELMDIIGKQSKPRMLDPITVWWGGDRYYVIDGHHRLLAYQHKKIKDTIPVEVFNGDLDAAMARAVYLNSKNKLPMTNTDRCNYAWKMVCVTRLSKRQIALSCGVSDRTVGNMRSAKVKLIEEQGSSLEDICELIWKDARLTASGWEPDENFDINAAMQEKALRFAKALTHKVGNQMFMDPEVFALALTYIDERLPKSLMETRAWQDALGDAVWNDEMDAEMDY